MTENTTLVTETSAPETETKKRRTSIRTNTLKVGATYDFEIYNNGQEKPVLRAPATIVSIPFEPFIVKDMDEDSALVIQVEGEEGTRDLTRINGKPFYLITRVDGKRNSRVRFHSMISAPAEETEASE